MLRSLFRQPDVVNPGLAMEGWASLVRDRHRWDFKHRILVELESPVVVFHKTDGTPYGVEYSVPGNIFYGYVGRSIFPGELLHLGAGYAEATDPSHFAEEHWYPIIFNGVCIRGFYIHPQYLATWYADPEDYRVVEFGIQLWEEYQDRLSESQFVQELEENRFELPPLPPIPYGSDFPFGWNNRQATRPYPVGHFNGSKPSWFERLGLFE